MILSFLKTGFDYLYLSEEDYNALPAGTVSAVKKILNGGEVHYVLDAIIGLANGIGVENLRGSGLIAGETSRAYDEVCRSFMFYIIQSRNINMNHYMIRYSRCRM